MLRTIIIDDEQDSREALRISLEKYCPEIKLVAVCDNPQEGIEKIKSNKPDLVFLDVQMPYMSGFDVLHHFPQMGFEVVFVTAHNHYAIKAIKFSALDYLLKPVGIDELRAAVKRAGEKINRDDNSSRYRSFFDNMKSNEQRLGKLSIPTANGLQFLDIHEIIYCKADDSYAEIYMGDKEKIVVSKTLKDIEEMLEGYSFFRIHQSYLINLKFMDRYVKGDGGHVIMKNGVSLDVSRRKKEEFLAWLVGH